MEVARQARQAGVSAIVIPAIAVFNFGTVRELAHAIPGGAYALGIHPLLVSKSRDEDLRTLREAITASIDDPRLVAIGEIGLDFFVKEIATGPARARQETFYRAQLEMAVEFGLPVLLHVRRSQDILLKHLRRMEVPGGIAHAFNGSTQQAQAFIDHGFALGIGGAMTFARALQIRRHAAEFGMEHLVLETDSPDIPPAWLQEPERRNTPAQVQGVAQALATLRDVPLDDVIRETGRSACRVLPRLGRLMQAG